MQTAALEKLDSGAHVDLVCSDIVLPGAIDGLALAAQRESRIPRTHAHIDFADDRIRWATYL